MKIAILLLALSAVCLAQVPQVCDSPKEWTGSRLLIDSSKEFYELSRIFYDEPNMRVRTIEEIQAGKEKDYYDVLRLHKENKEYRVNLRTKKCNVTSIQFPFRPIGVPRDAKFLFEGVHGAAGLPYESLTAVTFMGNYTMDDVRYITTVTYPDCVPVLDNYYNKITGYVESRYVDIHLGVSDPMAFIPPSVCM